MISNVFMGCRPRHPFFKFLIDFLTWNDRHKQSDETIATGQFLLYDAYEDVMKNTKRNIPVLGDDVLFQPVVDPRHAQSFVSSCKRLIGRYHPYKAGEKLEKAVLNSSVQ
jgi:hypothetical protein